MGLIPCPECKKNISETAANCPKCGYVLTPEKIAEIKKKQKELQKKAGIGCLALIGIIVLISVFGSNENKKNTEPTDIEAGIICNNYVEDRLKSPKSADFPMFDRVVKKTGPRSFRVISYVDAQNSFGAKIRTRFLCELTYKSGEWADKNNWTLDNFAFDQ